jgi:DNA-binding XRE family transcriptional regulator
VKAFASAHLERGERMMTAATLTQSGLEVTFADGRHGTVPTEAVFGNDQVPVVEDLRIPNPFVVQIVLRNKETVEIPWDFARHYCDPTYAARAEQGRDTGQATLGKRIQKLRLSAGLSQEGLARRADVGRLMLARLERGELSPRHETLVALSQALGVGLAELLLDR